MSLDLAVFIACLLFAVVAPTLRQQKLAALKATWRQKLTLEVSTPSGDVKGSAVTEIAYFPARASGRRRKKLSMQSRISGEAAVVEVKPGQFLFASLIDADVYPYGASTWVWSAFALKEIATFNLALEKLRSLPLGQLQQLPMEAWPVMVTFDDATRPETARRVDPANLSAVFGEGVRLKAVTLEITDEGVTEGRVEGVLGWLGTHPEPSLLPGAGRTSDVPFGMTVSQGDFIRRP